MRKKARIYKSGRWMTRKSFDRYWRQNPWKEVFAIPGCDKQQGFTNIDRVDNHELNVTKLERKRVPVIFYSPQGMAHTCKDLNYDLNAFEIVLVPYSTVSYIAMSKNGTSEKIVQQWHETAQQIKDDGTFDKIAEKWARYTREIDGVEAEVKDGALNFWKQ